MSTYAAVEVPYEEHQLALSDGHVTLEEALEGLANALAVINNDLAGFFESLFAWAVVGDVYVLAKLGKIVLGIEIAGSVDRIVAGIMAMVK